MTLVKFVEFHPRHIEVLDIRKEESESAFKLEDAFDRIEKIAANSLAAGTFLYDGRILACAGIAQIWPGVLEGWIIPSKYISKAPVAFAKYIRRYVEATAKTFKCHRFQTTSPDDAFHERWMTWLGFKKEGTMRKYTHDKKNYCIYARIF